MSERNSSIERAAMWNMSAKFFLHSQCLVSCNSQTVLNIKQHTGANRIMSRIDEHICKVSPVLYVEIRDRTNENYSLWFILQLFHLVLLYFMYIIPYLFVLFYLCILCILFCYSFIYYHKLIILFSALLNLLLYNPKKKSIIFSSKY